MCCIIDALNVISRTSSFYFKEKDIPLREIAAQLNAQTILEGSVRVAQAHAYIDTGHKKGNVIITINH